jgi:hypothetical protein
MRRTYSLTPLVACRFRELFTLSIIRWRVAPREGSEITPMRNSLRRLDSAAHGAFRRVPVRAIRLPGTKSNNGRGPGRPGVAPSRRPVEGRAEWKDLRARAIVAD